MANSRRRAGQNFGSRSAIFPQQTRRPVDGTPDPVIRPATTQVIQVRVDVRIGRFRKAPQEIHGSHDLPGLTIAALGNVLFDPRLLNGMKCLTTRETFYGHDFGLVQSGHGNRARASRMTVYMDRTGATAADAAPEFRALEIQNFAKVPEQRHVTIAAELSRLAIYLQGHHEKIPSAGKRARLLMLLVGTHKLVPGHDMTLHQRFQLLFRKA